ncbi:alginate export family protein [Flavihumibacter petaseus]|uniref:Alginate export domain-containing protein n=1 Tax=Flavihumibacter petaseus NBRC 106054 TaxID=1220578 RepID=A0A0E9N547_9BACT|nr:alginate export family protein [Flavihumibacter petaseus]GAO44826.1 hypothetical protein FPE01S_04_00690 [Flavihumibacter petaseus NBRC 106054]
MGKQLKRIPVLALLLLGIASRVHAQLSLQAQIRPRAELRGGVGTLQPKEANPAAFISQRSRLGINYQHPRLQLQFSLQDVRIWGQDASSVSNADGNRLSMHEAWAEWIIANKKDSSWSHGVLDYLSIRIGRQELVYDDQRLIGNLDWLQQARRHDAALIRMMQSGWQVDLALAFNQNTDAFTYNGTTYTPANVLPYVKDSKGNLAPTPSGFIPAVASNGNSAKNGTPALQNPPSTNAATQNYKAFQFLYAAKTWKQHRVAALLFADQFGRYTQDSVRNVAGTDTGYIYGKRFNTAGVVTRVTSGLQWNAALDPGKKCLLQAGAWSQWGKDRDGNNLLAWMGSINLTFKQTNWQYTAGFDLLSGNDALNPGSVNHRFDPLYGTPHKFWGQMDYFYAGTGAPAGGLKNPYLKVKYTGKSQRFNAGLDYHYFLLANDQQDAAGKAISRYLGSEFDLLMQYQPASWATLEYGAGFMAGTTSLAYAKNLNPDAVRHNGWWTYLSLNIRPSILINTKN